MKTSDINGATPREKAPSSGHELLWCHDHQGKGYTFEETLALAREFHGYPAPGLMLGVRMVSLAMENLQEDVLFDAISETRSCLPDAVQLLTLCTSGNNWLQILDLGRYAVSLYDKYTGEGVRVSIDAGKLENWPEIQTWLYKLKSKPEQDSAKLLAEIRDAGTRILRTEQVVIAPHLLGKKRKGSIGTCPACGEAYPLAHGTVCRACQGGEPYRSPDYDPADHASAMPRLKKIAVEKAEGRSILHDMTEVIPGKAKGPAFKHGQIISGGDICRLQQMGRQSIYVRDGAERSNNWVHEDQAALAFARLMAGEGVAFQETAREGKVTLSAARDGLFDVDATRLQAFNMVPNVMCASCKRFEVMTEGEAVAATRAIPLYLEQGNFHRAASVLRTGPIFRVRPLRRAQVGILVTGTEVFRGLVKDSFIPVIKSKVNQYSGSVVDAIIRPDDRPAIKEGILRLLKSGADLIVTTAGLSVDPDDVTRQGLIDAGCTDLLYGAPILPGAMTLLARIDEVQIIGVPACGLYHATTGFDLLYPRLLAGVPVTRKDLAAMGHGAFCRNCPTCTFPKCSFGR